MIANGDVIQDADFLFYVQDRIYFMNKRNTEARVKNLLRERTLKQTAQTCQSGEGEAA